MGKVRINTIGDESVEKKQKVKTEKRKEAAKAKVDKDAVGVANVPAVTEKKSEAKPVALKQKDAEKKASVALPGGGRLSARSNDSRGVSGNVTTAKRSKKYQTVAMLVDKTKSYSLAEALELLPKTHISSFDETIELHINTNESGINGNVTLPHGTGKQIRVAILAPNKDQKAADELLKQIESGNFNFDVLIATPDAMPKLAKFARMLGPRGLMPNPKTGTVTNKPEDVAKNYAGGQINFKTESKLPVIHMSVGKLSFKKEHLEANIKAAITAVQNKNIRNVTLKSTMSPGIKIQIP